MDSKEQEIHSLKIRIFALESSLKLSTKVIRDLMLGNNAKETRYRQLATELVVVNNDLLSPDREEDEYKHD